MFVPIEIKKVQGRAIHATLHNFKCLKYYYVKNVTVNSLIWVKLILDSLTTIFTFWDRESIFVRSLPGS